MHEIDTKELQIAMIESGYETIEQLSTACGINRNTLASVVKGRIYPSSKVMEALKIALHLTSERAGRIFFKDKISVYAN